MSEIQSPIPEQEKVTTLEAAKLKLLDFDDPEYLQEHEKPLEKPRHHVVKVGDQKVELVGPSHSYDPGSQMIKDTFDLVEQYLQQTSKDQQIVMVEGFHHGEPVAETTLEESVRLGGEPSGVTFLAKQAEVPVVSPEAPETLVVERCLQEGISREEVALFYALRHVPGVLRRGHSRGFAALRAVWEAGLISREEIDKDQEACEIRALEIVNQIAKEQLGQELVGSDDKLSLDKDEVYQFTRPDSRGEIGKPTNRVAAIASNVRDSYILEQINNALHEGKSPLVVYGASHIIKLKPAVEHLASN